MKYLLWAIILLFVAAVFSPTFFSEKLPIPADTIVGLYHPWRDTIKSSYPLGIPIKNFLVTDPVRQQYPWRNFGVDELKSGKLPLWNPYNFSGTPLAANFQSAPFYPLNVIHLLGKFPATWSVQVILQLLLGSFWMLLYLRSLKLSAIAQCVGVLSWVGSGFFVAWTQHNTLVQAVMWLPLVMLSIDRIFQGRRKFLWSFVLGASLSMCFLAGALQISIYLFAFAFSYTIYSLFKKTSSQSTRALLLALILLLLICSVQIVILVQFLNHASRTIDSSDFIKAGWFLPWQNLVQFVAPDFFGNPATMNYFGVWNYMEFIGYMSLPSLFFVFFLFLSPKTSFAKFLIGALAICFLLVLPNFLSVLPFEFNIPLLNLVQPTRLMVLIDFSLAVLSALGVDYFVRKGLMVKKIILTLAVLTVFLLIAWSAAIILKSDVSMRNLLLPTMIFLAQVFLLIAYFYRRSTIFLWVLVLVILFDLSRLALKFESFSEEKYLFGQTKILSFLQEQAKVRQFRVVSLDDRILPDNFNIHYQIQMPSGYDSLALTRYLEFIVAEEREEPVITRPWGFNRMVTPRNITSKLYPLLNVEYFLTFESLENLPNFVFVMQEGQTKLYRSTRIVPRAHFVSKLLPVSDRSQALSLLFSDKFKVGETAVVEGTLNQTDFSIGTAKIVRYSPGEIVLNTENSGRGFLVLGDVYYPAWKAELDGKQVRVFPTNYAFRGVEIPSGKHNIRFYIDII